MKRLWLWLRSVLHRCRRDRWTFVRVLSEQAVLFRCACGREWAYNHAVGAALPFDWEMRRFYRNLKCFSAGDRP